MTKKHLCKIVEDLLPNYIEKMTSSETNEIIEKHIEECQLCKDKLNNMKCEVVLDEVDDREINYLKTIKRKNRFKMLIFILVAIIIISLLLWFIFNCRIRKDDNGRYQIERATINYNNIKNYDILILKGNKQAESCIDNTLYITWYAIFDAKTEKCISIREQLGGYYKEKAEEQYNMMKNDWEELSNPRIEDNKIYMNINSYNEKTKDEVKKVFKEKYENIKIEEI